MAMVFRCRRSSRWSNRSPVSTSGSRSNRAGRGIQPKSSQLPISEAVGCFSLPMISRVAMLGDEPGSIIIAGIKEKKYYDRDTNSEIIYPSIATYGASELLLILSYYVLNLE